MKPKVKNYFKAMSKKSLEKHKKDEWRNVLPRRDFVWTIAKMIARASWKEDWDEYY